MKLKILILPALFILILSTLVTGTYIYLGQADLSVLPSPDGNPTLEIEDAVYFVRYWTPEPGCYRLTRIVLLDYNLASPAEPDRCPVESDQP